MKISKHNQVHPPRPNKSHIDILGNDRNRLWFKSGNSTMLFAQGLTRNAIKCLTSNIQSTLSQLGVKLEGQWLITRQDSLSET